MNKPIASLQPRAIPTGGRPGSKKVYQPGVIWPDIRVPKGLRWIEECVLERSS